MSNVIDFKSRRPIIVETSYRLARSTCDALDYLARFDDPARMARFLNGRCDAEVKAMRRYAQKQKPPQM